MCFLSLNSQETLLLVLGERQNPLILVNLETKNVLKFYRNKNNISKYFDKLKTYFILYILIEKGISGAILIFFKGC